MGGAVRDVFISYGHADADWVRTLAENFYQSGLELFFDEWDIAPGDVLVHKLDAGILASRSGILVVSPTALTRPYVQAEYAALMGRAIERGQQLIPVLLKDAEIPPLLAERIWVDFRNADGPDYLTRVRELVRALKGERPGPPTRTGELNLPAGSGFKAAGSQSFRLTIVPGRTTLFGNDVEVAGPPPLPDFDFDELQWKLQRARANCGPQRDAVGAAPGYGELETVLHELGGKLADVFLSVEVAAALAKVVAEAERLNGTLQLALDIADPFVDLPWETLRLPEAGVLALHPRVELFRRIATGGAAPAISIPGPLRILVAIGSPEAQNARGELLDMEAELQRILDVTDAPRRAGKACVHILEQGSIDAIQKAIAARHYHVLHISCHTGLKKDANGKEDAVTEQRALILEHANGEEDKVTAQRLCDEAIPAEGAPSLVVLAGCSTGEIADPADESGAGRLPGLARTLVKRGVPAVIAMQAPVGDRYATDLMGCVYEALASWQEPRPLAALGHARRVIEDRRRRDTSVLRPPEWATPAFFCAAVPLRLFDATVTFEKLREAPEPTFDPGVVVRRIGDMVGRRREQRLILRALRDADGAGVLIHGIGGVGKSTLAAQILHRLADDGFLLFSLKGETDPDRVLSAIATRLFSVSLAEGGDEKHPMRQLAGVLREPKYPWRDRFELLSQNLLARVPVAFLFDNFEETLPKDNPAGGTPPEELAALLARWLQAPLKSRLVFTCRCPFSLTDDAHERLEAFHLGPLSWAETRKLFWRLGEEKPPNGKAKPLGLKWLSLEEQRGAYETVGGHPRALEYLDAILRGGKAQFDDVTIRLRKKLKTKGITDPARWCADTGGRLDAALAETVTLAADDVLLDELLKQIEVEPLARKLLIGASVYRFPVKAIELMVQVSDRTLVNIERLGGVVTLIDPPERYFDAQALLINTSLLSPVRYCDDEEERFMVHRWTAHALQRKASQDQVISAHKRAAQYHMSQVESEYIHLDRNIEHLVESRYHFLQAKSIEDAVSATKTLCMAYDKQGAWAREEKLCRDTLNELQQNMSESAVFQHQLGLVMQRRGNYDEAVKWYLRSLESKEVIGDSAGLAPTYGQLGSIARRKGDDNQAREWYQKALTIEEAQQDWSNMATTCDHLGIMACQNGDYEQGTKWFERALAARTNGKDDIGVAQSYVNIGRVWNDHYKDYIKAENFFQEALRIFNVNGRRVEVARTLVNLAELVLDKGEDQKCVQLLRQSLEISEEVGDIINLASPYNVFGRLAFLRKDYHEAAQWYEKSVAILKSLGHQNELRLPLALMGHSNFQLGNEAMQRGDTKEAERFYHKALESFEGVGDRDHAARVCVNLGVLAGERAKVDEGVAWCRRALSGFEALGNHNGIALALGQIGALLTINGNGTEALSFSARSLALFLKMNDQQGISNMPWMARQRNIIGHANFEELLSHYLTQDDIQLVVKWCETNEGAEACDSR